MFKSIGLSQFVERQLTPSFSGTQITHNMVKNLFKIIKKGEFSSYNGYADFCKILSIKNRINNKFYYFKNLYSLTVNRRNALAKGAHLHTAYEARTREELPVLSEWVENYEPPIANFIHIIVYNRKQMLKEGEIHNYDWLVVSIQTGMEKEVEPMKPITALRNSLGIEFGGSGVPLDKKSYQQSVSFWSKHISIRKKL